MILGLSGGIQAKATGVAFDSAHQPGLAEPSATQLKDYSRFKNHGSFKADGHPDWVWNGRLWVMSFDASAPDYVDCGNHVSLQVAGVLCLIAWVNTSSSDLITPIAKYEYSSGDQRAYKLSLGDGFVYLYISSDGSAVNTINRRSILTVNDAVPHQIVGVFFPSLNMDIYIDGVLNNGVLSGAIPAKIHNSTDSVYIGADNAGAAHEFSGQIARPRILNRILSATKLGAGDGSIFKAEKWWFAA